MEVSQISALEVFIDDKNTSNSATANDDFVVAEQVLGTSPNPPRTLVRTPLGSGPISAAYGFTALRPNNGTSDILVVGEPSGHVSVWSPATAGGALQAWHALDRVVMPGSTNGLAGLRVTPGSPQTAEVIFRSPSELAFTTPPNIQQSLPVRSTVTFASLMPGRGSVSSAVRMSWLACSSTARLPPRRSPTW
jgi:hypothetical protein